MKLKELAAVIMSLAALVSSVTGLVTALKAKEKAGEAKAEVRQVDERYEGAMIHTQVEEGKEDMAIRAKVADLERRLAEYGAASRP